LKKKKFASIKKELEKKYLTQKLKIDDLTGVYNRNAFKHEVKQMAEDPENNSYIFVMIDIDNFKIINEPMDMEQATNALLNSKNLNGEL
jgi:diguanylate cyclase